MAATVSQKGQVVIPKAVRKALGIEPGSRVEFELEGLEARLKVVRHKISRLEDGAGMLKYIGPRVSIADMNGEEAMRRRGKL
ncbi:MAG: AbrB/MazE/SpoVT family DNA-binding domain-containing protein [Burkholderiales bacterium]|nr:AbrB/MazE/SpoVT family DNA-binding domain-containing protein [Burkholderiales bacterium]